MTYLTCLCICVRLIALSLELPEDALINMHSFDAEAGTWVRFMK